MQLLNYLYIYNLKFLYNAKFRIAIYVYVSAHSDIYFALSEYAVIEVGGGGKMNKS